MKLKVLTHPSTVQKLSKLHLASSILRSPRRDDLTCKTYSMETAISIHVSNFSLKKGFLKGKKRPKKEEDRSRRWFSLVILLQGTLGYVTH